MNSHIDRHFDEELTALKQKILKMGDSVELMVTETLSALCDIDQETSESIADSEKSVNMMQIEIDEICLKLIALHQPTANDLRFLLGVVKINNELERVGDHAINICQRISKIKKSRQLKPYIDLPSMIEKTRDMFKDSLRAFVGLDTDKARAILIQDDEVDALKTKIIDECIEFIRKDPATAPIAVSIIILANNLEKIADHATNIAEIVIFVAQGKDIRHHVEDQSI